MSNLHFPSHHSQSKNTSVYSAFQIPANSAATDDSGSYKNTTHHNNDGSAQSEARSYTENR